MSLDLIVAEHVAPRPWLNGGGLTRDLLSWPASGEWAWRISLADVAQDGPFSAYPGITRWFTVVQGAGVMLRFEGKHMEMSSESEPVCFDGAQQPHCTLQDGSSRDLNLMTRDGVCRGLMQRAQPGQDWTHAAPRRAVFAAQPMTLQIDDAQAVRMPAMSLLVSDQAAGQCWRAIHRDASSAAWWMAIERVHKA
jgi:environmental stress-induced protein Ves